MNIHFDTSAFEKDPKGLIAVLSNLHMVGSWSVRHDREIEKIVCRTPTSALNYCRHVNHAFGVSREAERVFLKTPRIGIRYLRLVNRRSFQDEDTQVRFWRKVVKSPDLCYEWGQAFQQRVSEQEEEVFVRDVRVAKNYAFFVIREPFPEKVHNMLVLRSFEDMDNYSKRCLTEYIRWADERGVPANS